MGKNFPRYALLLADLVGIVVAFRIAYGVRYALVNFIPPVREETFASYWPAMAMAVGAWILLFRAFELDRSYLLSWDFPLAVSRLLMSLTVLMGALLAGSYLARTFYSRLLLIFLPPLLTVLFGGIRLMYRDLLKWTRKYGWGVRRVVIVGQSDLARELANRIRNRRELNYEFAGFLFPTTSRSEVRFPRATSGPSEDIATELALRNVHELLFAIPVRRDSETLEFIAACQKRGIAVKLVPEYYQLHTNQIQSFSIDGIPVLELKEISLDPPYQLLKSILDYSLAIPLAVIALPFMVAIGIALFAVQHGKVIKRDVRIGLRGRPFVIYQFNVETAKPLGPGEERSWEVRFCNFLLRYSLSELPQLWNVLKGDMSLVGPRPESWERVRYYSAWHKRRLQLKPGITGLAQVNGLRGSDPSDRKTKYDLEYAANFSPFLDIALMLATMPTLLRRPKARLSPPPTGPIMVPDGALRQKLIQGPSDV
jgi:lipopolysaccharide/colanic/teichoic acid biosynthesis glycosyltransferase